MAISVKDIDEKLGEEKVGEILDKDWKVAEPPTEEELSKENHDSSKARSNPNSRKNLVQYGKRTKKAKKAAVKNLQYVEKEEDIDPADIFGADFDYSVINKIMPVLDILKNRAEQEQYYNVIALFCKDFKADELTFSDVDDVVTLAINKVLESRLLKQSLKSDKLLIDAGPTLEKFRKHSDKVKSNLASRRVDRVDSKHKPKLSIVDLAAQLDLDEELDFQRRVAQLEREDREYRPPTIVEDEDDGE